MRRSTIAALALALAAPVAVSAQEVPAGPAQQGAVAGETAAKPAQRKSAENHATGGDPDRRVCKNLVATGSRLAKGRVCKKAREWQAQTEDDRKTLNRMQKVWDNQGG